MTVFHNVRIVLEYTGMLQMVMIGCYVEPELAVALQCGMSTS